MRWRCRMSLKTDVLSGSHLPVLADIVLKTNGAVLEMGMGLNSTPLLHWVCTAHQRQLVSLENDIKWIEPNKAFENEFHKVELIKDWDKAKIDSTHWSVVLIDHRPALRRKVDAVRLKNRANFILLHDSEPEINRFYGYSRVYPHFKYVYHYRKVKPFTTVLSNFINIKHFLGEKYV